MGKGRWSYLHRSALKQLSFTFKMQVGFNFAKFSCSVVNLG